VTFNYYTPKGAVSRGTWVVAAKAVPGIKLLVNTMWDSRFPLFKVAESSDYYKGGTGNDADKRLMNGNISSGFNCRTVTGTTSWSNHAYGLAVDINPLWNPYVTKQGVQPPASKPWMKKRKGTGVLEAKGTIVKKMTAAGWTWGGYWSNPDYQHLELK
jgi:poly-gamma-glutamate synthesis protein (capsule biosynthesis protein)